MPAKKYILRALCVSVSFGLLAWLILRMDFGAAGQVLREARHGWLVAALLFTFAIPVCSVIRWMGVLRSQADLQIGFPTALRAVLMANALNSFLPSKAGDAAKAFYLRKQGGLSRGVGTVILERSIDFFVLGLLGVVGFFIGDALWGLLVGLLLIGMVCSIFLAVLFFPLDRLPVPPEVIEKMQGFSSVFHSWLRRPSCILQTFLGSFGTWSLAGLTVCALASAFAPELSWGYAYGIFPLAILAGLVPVTLSGVGTRDSAFVFLLASRVSDEQATLIGLGYTLFGYWILSLISLPVVWYEIRHFYRSRQIGDTDS